MRIPWTLLGEKTHSNTNTNTNTKTITKKSPLLDDEGSMDASRLENNQFKHKHTPLPMTFSIYLIQFLASSLKEISTWSIVCCHCHSDELFIEMEGIMWCQYTGFYETA